MADPQSLTQAKWLPEFGVGNPFIDNEHKTLLELINIVNILSRTTPNRVLLEYVLERLVDYTETHFKDEEQLLARAGYKDLENHHRLHEALKKNTIEMRNRILAAQATDASAMNELLKTLKGWWVDHIIKVDRHCREWFEKVDLVR